VHSAIDKAPVGFHSIELGEGFGEHFGRMYIKTSPEGDVLGFRVLEHHLNKAGFCHGGAIAFFADMQLAAVEQQVKTHQFHHPTKNINIDFIAPVASGAWLEMSVQLVRETRSSLYTQAVMTVEGKVAVRTTANYHIAS
jgi:uncharacterized protein (TIGR00369 family)